MTLSPLPARLRYIPLGGNRLGSRAYVNLLITDAAGRVAARGGRDVCHLGRMHGCFLAVNHAWEERGWSCPVGGEAPHAARVFLGWPFFFRSHGFQGKHDALGTMFGGPHPGPDLPNETQSSGWR